MDTYNDTKINHSLNIVSYYSSNYMDDTGIVTINITAFPKHPEEKETSSNRNNRITIAEKAAFYLLPFTFK